MQRRGARVQQRARLDFVAYKRVTVGGGYEEERDTHVGIYVVAPPGAIVQSALWKIVAP